jgi:predicted dienelactone hydrolase
MRMMALVALWAVVWSGALMAQAVVGGEVKAADAVAIHRFTWRDAKRNRDVPVKVYLPSAAKSASPVIILSHGLGGSSEGYEYLGRYWAQHGYVSVHPQHIGSDDSVWKGKRPRDIMPAMRKAAADPSNALNRAKDVSFVLDELEKASKADGPLKGRLDMTRVGMAGHSFGAQTTLAVSGLIMGNRFVGEISLADPRIKAAVPMSAPIPRRRDNLGRIYSKIKIPCLHMTGTNDNSIIHPIDPKDRRIPFDRISGGDQYLIVFKDGDHMVFSGGKRRRGNGKNDAVFQELIRRSSTAFWDAYLKGDAEAKAWLSEGGFEKALGENGAFEKKNGRTSRRRSAATSPKNHRF